MRSPDTDDEDPVLSGLLRAARPAPSLSFGGALERELFPPRRRLREHRLVVGLTTATALASVLLVVALVGGGPLAPQGGDDARAKPPCTTVYVTSVVPTGEVVRRADGTVTVETSRKPVTRAEQRCP